MGRITIHVHGLAKEKAYNMMLEIYQNRLKARNVKIIQHSGKKSLDDYVSDIGKNSHLVLFDERGKKMTSLEFAAQVKKWSIDSRDVSLAIGPVDGWNSYTNKTKNIISLSTYTFPHELAAVMLAEQVYRATEINKGTKYHRD